MAKKYIDADVLIDLLYEFEPENWTNSDKELQAVNDFELFRSLIKAEPAADVEEVKHGEWMCKDEKGSGICSNCNRQDHIDPLATHCRYCGAKMDMNGKEK